MEPKLLRASVLGFLVGCIIVYVYCYYVSPIIEMQSLLQESNRDKEKIIDLEEMVRRKDDSLDVFKLDLAEQQAYDKQTWKQGKLDTLNIDDWVLIEHNGLQIWLPIIEPDTLDSLEGE
jgi:hypothetical protein